MVKKYKCGCKSEKKKNRNVTYVSFCKLAKDQFNFEVKRANENESLYRKFRDKYSSLVEVVGVDAKEYNILKEKFAALKKLYSIEILEKKET